MRRIVMFVAALTTGVGVFLLQVGTANASPLASSVSATQSNGAGQSNRAEQSGSNRSSTTQWAPAINLGPQLAVLGSNTGSTVVSAPSSDTNQGISQKVDQSNGAGQSGTAVAVGGSQPHQAPCAKGDKDQHGQGQGQQGKGEGEGKGQQGKGQGQGQGQQGQGQQGKGSAAGGAEASQSNQLGQSNNAKQSASNSSKTTQIAPAINVQPQLALLGSNGGSTVVSAPSSSTNQGIAQSTSQTNGAGQSGLASALGSPLGL